MKIRSSPPRLIILERAFTLTELLAVVAVVALLALARFPAMSHTRNRSQDTVDFYNNKQLMSAANMYAADQNDTLPGCGWGTGNDAWAYVKNIFGGYSAQLNFLRQGQLFPYVRTEKVFMCPIDKPNSLYYQRAILITSYTWNAAVCGYGNLTYPNGFGSYKVAQFKPNAIIQWEEDESVPFFFNDGSSLPDEGISGRHGNSVTVGTISGGIQRIPFMVWYSSSFAGTSGQRGGTIPASQLPNQAWCNPGTHYGLANY